MPPRRPAQSPACPYFSSGPCAKRPGWTLAGLQKALIGRSHRSTPGKNRLEKAIQKTADLLTIPTDYCLAIVPGSGTGAIELAIWNLLGPRGVDILAWDVFGHDWVHDVRDQLKLSDTRLFEAPQGQLPDLTQTNPDHDILFTWNGTTSGVCVPDGDWIATDRTGLTLCDATSAVFAMDLPWDKLDVTSFSWQKALGGEAAHGMLILSPRALKRLEEWRPTWPIPKLFRLTKNGKFLHGVFHGETLNTPSMLCVEDWLDGLSWVEEMGGLSVIQKRCATNLAILEAWEQQRSWVGFTAKDPASRSCSSVCLDLIEPRIRALDTEQHWKIIVQITTLLAEEKIAYDINGHRAGAPGLRLWCGPTIEPDDVTVLLPWLDWAYETVLDQAFNLS